MGGGGMKGGGPADDLEKLRETKYPYKKIVIYPDDFSTVSPTKRTQYAKDILSQSIKKRNLLIRDYKNKNIPFLKDLAKTKKTIAKITEIEYENLFKNLVITNT
jgi:hypothetical protein